MRPDFVFSITFSYPVITLATQDSIVVYSRGGQIHGAGTGIAPALPEGLKFEKLDKVRIRAIIRIMMAGGMVLKRGNDSTHETASVAGLG